jgi:hypothetical protein
LGDLYIDGLNDGIVDLEKRRVLEIVDLGGALVVSQYLSKGDHSLGPFLDGLGRHTLYLELASGSCDIGVYIPRASARLISDAMLDDCFTLVA